MSVNTITDIVSLVVSIIGIILAVIGLFEDKNKALGDRANIHVAQDTTTTVVRDNVNSFNTTVVQENIHHDGQTGAGIPILLTLIFGFAILSFLGQYFIIFFLPPTIIGFYFLRINAKKQELILPGSKRWQSYISCFSCHCFTGVHLATCNAIICNFTT